MPCCAFAGGHADYSRSVPQLPLKPAALPCPALPCLALPCWLPLFAPWTGWLTVDLPARTCCVVDTLLCDHLELLFGQHLSVAIACALFYTVGACGAAGQAHGGQGLALGLRHWHCPIPSTLPPAG